MVSYSPTVLVKEGFPSQDYGEVEHRIPDIGQMNSIGWQSTETHSGILRDNLELGLFPCPRDGCLARGPYLQKQSGEGNLQLGHWRPYWFSQMSRQYLIMSLNFRLYSTRTVCLCIGPYPHIFQELLFVCLFLDCLLLEVGERLSPTLRSNNTFSTE